MESKIKKWENKEGIIFLRRIGIKPNQTVLDFGCRVGHYTIPAAKIVRRKGIVYALDKNSNSLDELMERAKGESLDNIKRVDTPRGLRIPLPKESIDVVLLYDVVHLVGKNDSSVLKDRKRLYKEIYRVTKPNGLVSVYPSHLKTHTDITSNEEIKREIEGIGFSFEKEEYVELIHDNKKTTGYILNFKKTKK